MERAIVRLFLCSAFVAVLSSRADAVTAVGTETVLGREFGVNLHLDNCCKGDYGDINTVINQIRYIGARRLRDWATRDKVLEKWREVHEKTGLAFHASIPETSPAHQRLALVRIERWLHEQPGMIEAIEGGNEEDNPYPRSQGASLEDSAAMQSDVYEVGRRAHVPVAQLSVGAGWAAPLYEGNYKKFGTPPADYGNAHVYMNPGSPPAVSLQRLGDLAAWSVAGKPVDVTEFGTYHTPKQSDEVTSAFMHEAPFDAYLMGRAGLFVYALHDDVSHVVSFYDAQGHARPFADYWHHTTQALADPKGKHLPPKELRIGFTPLSAAGKPPLGIKNVAMYKSDGSIWIAAYDEERAGAADNGETIALDGTYDSVRVIDGRTGEEVNHYHHVRQVTVPLPVNHVYLVTARREAERDASRSR